MKLLRRGCWSRARSTSPSAGPLAPIRRLAHAKEHAISDKREELRARRCRRASGLLLGASLAVCCSPLARVPEPPLVYVQQCSSCHGASGHGDGQAARLLNPKPRDFSDEDWQRSVSDAQLRHTIQVGGEAVRLNPAMPSHLDLSEDQLTQLIAYIRSVGGIVRPKGSPSGS